MHESSYFEVGSGRSASGGKWKKVGRPSCRPQLRLCSALGSTVFFSPPSRYFPAVAWCWVVGCVCVCQGLLGGYARRCTASPQRWPPLPEPSFPRSSALHADAPLRSAHSPWADQLPACYISPAIAAAEFSYFPFLHDH